MPKRAITKMRRNIDLKEGDIHLWGAIFLSPKVRPIKAALCTKSEAFSIINTFFAHSGFLDGKNLRAELCRNTTSERLVLVFDYGKYDQESSI